MKFLPLFAALLIVSCAKPETPQQIVYQSQVAYNAAATVAVKYINLPRCPATPLCSKPEVVFRVKQADTVAYNSIKSAQEAVRTPGIEESKVTFIAASAKAAVGAFVKITNELPKE